MTGPAYLVVPPDDAAALADAWQVHNDTGTPVLWYDTDAARWTLTAQDKDVPLPIVTPTDKASAIEAAETLLFPPEVRELRRLRAADQLARQRADRARIALAEHMAKMRADGWSMGRLADALGVSRQEINRRSKEHAR